jgi:hypothetical protein
MGAAGGSALWRSLGGSAIALGLWAWMGGDGSFGQVGRWSDRFSGTRVLAWRTHVR